MEQLDSRETPSRPIVWFAPSRALRISVVGLFVIALFAVLYFARNFFMPILVAVILALTLRPIVRSLARRHVSPVLTSIVLTAALAGAAAVAAYAVFVPAVDWINRAPEIGRELQDKLSDLRAPAEAIAEAEEQIEQVTSPGSGRSQTVTVEGPGLFSTAASGVLSAVATMGVSLLLMAFFLSSGDLFYTKIVQSFDKLKDKKRALQLLTDLEREISRYLLTISLINVCLGACVGVGFHLLGMPMPQVWAVVAALANFMPYIGGILGVGAAAAVAIVSFDSIAHALLIPALYAACTIVEGQLVTPLIVGRRLELNIVAVFVSVALWAWLWGITGALIAVPILVIVKTICDHVESLNSFGNFLTAATATSVSDDEDAGEAT